MQKMQFYLSISSDQYLAYYNGVAKFVNVQTNDGRTLNFPASELQKFVTREGIHGKFEIEFNEQHKLMSLTRV